MLDSTLSLAGRGDTIRDDPDAEMWGEDRCELAPALDMDLLWLPLRSSAPHLTFPRGRGTRTATSLRETICAVSGTLGWEQDVHSVRFPSPAGGRGVKGEGANPHQRTTLEGSS